MSETVYFLGTNDITRQSAELLVGAMGYTICSDASEDTFVERYRADEPGCVVLNAVGRNFDTCVHWARSIATTIPVIRIIMICGECETSDVVRAMRTGLSSVLELPFSYKDMEQAVENAIQESHRSLHENRNRLAPEVAAVLTREEQEIAQMLLDGAGTKQISVKLDLSIRTIHYRKKAMFNKLGIDGHGQSLRMLLNGERQPTESQRQSSLN